MNTHATIHRSPDLASLRLEVRAFLNERLTGFSDAQRSESWLGFDRSFSEDIGRRGWIGMTWPKRYGGQELPLASRYVVQEEMLAVGAPVAAHWVAERQSGPLLLRLGTEEQRRALLPRIAAGQLTFCIGMSEPEAGSDLAAIRTRAERTDGGWFLNGQKLWTTHAAQSHFMIVLARTAPVDTDRRHAGMSQFLVDMSLPGITVRPIRDMAGGEHFNEVIFDDVRLENSALVGEEGAGWSQVMGELALERSGPERFLSSLPLLSAFASKHDRDDDASVSYLGRAFAELLSLRELSLDVVEAFAADRNPSVEATIVKNLGADFEQSLVAEIADLTCWDGTLSSPCDRIADYLGNLSLTAPSFSLRGGTREILRGIIARELVR